MSLLKRKRSPSLVWLCLLVSCAGCVKTNYIGGTYFEKGTVTGTAIINNSPVELTIDISKSYLIDEDTLEEMLTQP